MGCFSGQHHRNKLKFQGMLTWPGQTDICGDTFEMEKDILILFCFALYVTGG